MLENFIEICKRCQVNFKQFFWASKHESWSLKKKTNMYNSTCKSNALSETDFLALELALKEIE